MSIVPSDVELVERCLAKHQDAWRELIVRYRRLIYSIALAYRLAVADDVFQTVSVKLFENLGKLRNRNSLAAWISTTTRRECIAAKRKQERSISLGDQPLDEIGVEPEDLAESLFELECEHTLHLALERLDALCRALIHAFYIEDPTPSYKDVAARIERPIGSLGPTRGRCLERLRRRYLDLGGETPDGVSTDSQDPLVE